MQGEQEGENNSKSSPFYQEATDQKDKHMPEFVLKPSTCCDAQTRRVHVRLGCVCRGGVMLPMMGPRGWVGWRRTPSRPDRPWELTPATAATLPVDT